MSIITLTTDFGTRDGYVGAMKGVISRIAPGVPIIDIAHDIPPGDIAHAAWVVANSTLEFPHESIHIVVVDPGVGSSRHGVIVKIPVRPPVGQQLYVGPDNGVFAYLGEKEGTRIEQGDWAPTEVSATFHGRDIFAHVGALLAQGKGVGYFGKKAKLEGALPWGSRTVGTGRIVHIDRFGNLITDLPERDAGDGIVIDGTRLQYVRTYADVEAGELLAYIGSAGTVEIAIRDGRADEKLGAERGWIVKVWKRGTPMDSQTGPYR